MAVIRTVSNITHYEMDVNDSELVLILASLRYRLNALTLTMEATATTVQLITVIEGRLKHG